MDGQQIVETEQTENEGLNPNLDIWDAVQTTDPKHTKEFSRPGGFKGTAPNAVYNAKRATELFGPMGKGWGIDLVEERYVDGKPVLTENGQCLGHERVHIGRYLLWYKPDGETRFEISVNGCTTFVGVNRHGWFTDEDATKKSQTDAMSKGLSLLGFSADIHMGMYDDNKYVADLRLASAEQDADKVIDQGKKTEQLNKEMVGPIKTMSELQKHWRQFASVVAEQTSLDSLIALKEEQKTKALIEQLKVDAPRIWDMEPDGNGGLGIKQRLEAKEAELLEQLEQ